MGWTDERVETLKKLWLDGLSASQIAKHLGGVTRNAVIGKVHRLGLSGRAAPSQPADPVFKAPRPARPAAGAVPTSRRATAAATPPVTEAPSVESTATEAAPATVAAPQAPKLAAPAPAQAPLLVAAVVAPAPVAVEARVEGRVLARIEERGVATVLTLGARMCKWPIGDPSSDEFTFCGRRNSEDGPYCQDHARLAYQPQQSKKKSSSTELARSLRRYV
jgi:GcrA cell cycle regulator